MRVLGLASYPIQAAATRYRLHQYIGPLNEYGIELTVRPFLSSQLFAHFYRRKNLTTTTIGLSRSTLMRFLDLARLPRIDVLFLQREAAIFGPPLIEWLATRVLRCPMVLDLDDATYVSYTSPTYGSLGTRLKWFSKTDDLIRWASIVTCGNRSIAEYVRSKGTEAQIIPTVVDLDVFKPIPRPMDSPPVLGWIGTHSTFPYLESIFPALQKLASKHEFKLKIVGSGKEMVEVPGIDVENVEWQMERELADLQSFDIGLYPIDAGLYAEKWAAGKSGFKAIQYMAVGIPYVATPVGAVAEIGLPERTHKSALTSEEWYSALDWLIVNRDQRKQMGAAGRQHACEHYSLPAQAKKLAEALKVAAEKGKATR